MRLNTASGSAVRFKPGQQRTAELVNDAAYSEPLNESGFVKNTIAATKGRFLGAFHIEGASGFHVPLSSTETGADLAQALGLPVVRVSPSSCC